MASYSFCKAEDGIRDIGVTGVQTCALPIFRDEGDLFDLDADALRRVPLFTLSTRSKVKGRVREAGDLNAVGESLLANLEGAKDRPLWRAPRGPPALAPRARPPRGRTLRAGATRGHPAAAP